MITIIKGGLLVIIAVLVGFFICIALIIALVTYFTRRPQSTGQKNQPQGRAE